MNAGRRFAVASLVGGLIALAAFSWMLTEGRFDFAQHQRVGDFYDAQAHAFLDLRWDVPPEVVGIEGFIVDGRAYMYFGPVPALLRLPVAAFTDAFDGRLSQASMLLAFLVATAALARLHWQIRRLVRGASDVGRLETVFVAATTAVAAGGGSMLYLASRAWVFHEATLWGIAWALAAYSATVDYLIRPGTRRLAGASVLAALALLSRPSVGVGPTVALTVVLTATLLRTLVIRLEDGPSSRRRMRAPLAAAGRAAPAIPGARRIVIGGLLTAVLVPVALSVWVNEAKFGTPAGIPIEKQVWSSVDQHRQDVLDANDGTLFGAQFAPTTVWQYVRPDAIAFDRLFPWVEFPARRSAVIGDVAFDTLDRASSIPTSLTVLVVLGAFGGVAVFRRRSEQDEPGLTVLRAPIIGAAAGVLPVLTIAFVAHRYTADAFPLVVIPALAGLHLVFRDAGTWRPWTRRLAAGGVVLLAAWTAYANFSLGLLYQRAHSDDVREATRAGFVELQTDVDRALFGGSGPDVVRTDSLPPSHAHRDDLAVLGDCAGVYRSTGREWLAVERTNATGRFRFRVVFADAVTSPEPLLTNGRPDDIRTFLAVETVEPGTVLFSYRDEGVNHAESRTIEVGRGGSHVVDVVMDQRTEELTVELNGRPVFETFHFFVSGEDHFTIGRAPQPAPVEARFSGEIENLPVDAGLCFELTRRE